MLCCKTSMASWNRLQALFVVRAIQTLSQREREDEGNVPYDRMNTPHPGPLPRGEGGSPEVSGMCNAIAFCLSQREREGPGAVRRREGEGNV